MGMVMNKIDNIEDNKLFSGSYLQEENSINLFMVSIRCLLLG